MVQAHYSITVESTTEYISDQSFPDGGRYVFSYTITLTNTGLVPATLLSRHWLITDANYKVQEVRGKGVIGKQPHLIPGESYQYTSAAVLETPVGCMQGIYKMLGDDGVEFNAPVPVFNFSTPNTIH